MNKLNNIGLSTHPCFNPKKLFTGLIYPFPILTQYLIEERLQRKAYEEVSALGGREARR